MGSNCVQVLGPVDAGEIGRPNDGRAGAHEARAQRVADAACNPAAGPNLDAIEPDKV
jgi:hypothetical protein